MSKFSALRISKHVHQRAQSEGLPEPIGLSVNREGELSLSFMADNDAFRWRAELDNPVRTSPDGPYYEAWSGLLMLGNGDLVRTTVVLLP